MTFAEHLLYAFDLFGTGAFALAGAIRAIDRRPDLVGMLMIAGLTAIGGGTLRDLLLQRPVLSLRDIAYPLVVIVAVLVTFAWPHHLLRREKLVRYFDAIGLGTFAAITARFAWHTPGLNFLSVMMLACVAGCAGGVVRDLILDKTTLVMSNEIYITAVGLGTLLMMALLTAGASDAVAVAAGAVCITGLRTAGIYFQWQLPRLRYTVDGGRARVARSTEKRN